VPKDVGSDQDHGIYRGYDGRVVTRHMIDSVLEKLEARQRRRERIRQLRTWALLALLVVVLLGAALAVIWWRLTLPI
jgi:hypothetical protein